MRLINTLKVIYNRKILNIVLVLIVLIPIVLSIFYIPISPDSSYYLASVERLREGFLPYNDFAFGYTPLMLYMMSGLKILFCVGINYEVDLVIFYFLEIIVAYLIYKISRQLGIHKTYSFFESMIFLLITQRIDGNMFLLEIPSVLFGLLSLFIIIKYSNIYPTKYFIIFLGGIFSSFAFLVKQYGLGFECLVIFYALLNKATWKIFVLNFFGFIFPILFFYFYFGESFVNVLSGSNYNGYGDGKITIFIKFIYYLKAFINLFFKIIPILVITIGFCISVFNKQIVQRKKTLLFLLSGVLVFMVQFMFGPFYHYYIYVIPIAIILIFYVLQIIKYKKIYIVFIFLSVLLNFGKVYSFVYKKYINDIDDRRKQYVLAEELKKIIPPNSSLFIADGPLISQYYLTNLSPPNMQKYGYSFGSYSTLMIIEQINSADYILVTKNSPEMSSIEVQNVLRERKKNEINETTILYK